MVTPNKLEECKKDPPITASFSQSVKSGTAPLTVQFWDTSTGPVDKWSWDFGDGGTSKEKKPLHIYQEPGTYPVTLTVRHDDCPTVAEKHEPSAVIVHSQAPVKIVESPTQCTIMGFISGRCGGGIDWTSIFANTRLSHPSPQPTPSGGTGTQQELMKVQGAENQDEGIFAGIINFPSRTIQGLIGPVAGSQEWPTTANPVDQSGRPLPFICAGNGCYKPVYNSNPVIPVSGRVESIISPTITLPANCPGNQSCFYPLCNCECKDLKNDNTNCGQCGVTCSRGQICSNGACGSAVPVEECRSGFTNCNGACVNRQSDPANCGQCGVTCSRGQICSNGACGSAVPVEECRSGFTNCNGACVNRQSDPANCGQCGVTCSRGQICSNGACGSAVPVEECGSGRTNCNGACVNRQSDPANCGQCGVTCSRGQICSNGACGSMPVEECRSGFTICNGACVNRQSDPANCGQCGVTCSRGQICSNGACGSMPVEECRSGFAICNGACVNRQSDPANCGQCGVTCPRGQICLRGTCIPGEELRR